jgi:hypothetical protein
MARISLAALAALCCLAAACSSGSSSPPPVVVNPGSTLTFSPTTIYAWRVPAACGVANPPYGPGDIYSLQAVGAQVQGPRTGFAVMMPQAVAAGTSYDLVPAAVVTIQNPQSISRTQNASPPDGALYFQFSWSEADLGEIDPNPLDHVGITVVAFPSADGDPLTVHYVLHFTDQQTLDVTISGASATQPVGCAAG